MDFTSFLNGSLARERIRDECADGSWEKFDKLLMETPPGNEGNIGLFLSVHYALCVES